MSVTGSHEVLLVLGTARSNVIIELIEIELYVIEANPVELLLKFDLVLVVRLRLFEKKLLGEIVLRSNH